MSEENDLALEETEGDQLQQTCVSFFFKGLGSGYSIDSKELLNDVRALWWRICSGAIKRQEESCATKGKHACCSKEEVFLKRHGRVLKV